VLGATFSRDTGQSFFDRDLNFDYNFFHPSLAQSTSNDEPGTIPANLSNMQKRTEGYSQKWGFNSSQECLITASAVEISRLTKKLAGNPKEN
jgi:hypothetical protein